LTHDFQVGEVTIGGGALSLIAGPCVIESEAHALKMAEVVDWVSSKRRSKDREDRKESNQVKTVVVQPGASIAGVAREHGVNANMVHYWRKLYREGRLGQNKADSVRLLPVTVSEAVRLVRYCNRRHTQQRSSLCPSTFAITEPSTITSQHALPR
jgi:transposase-like protein